MAPTLHTYRNYVFRIDYEAEDPAYIVNYPDIPDINTSGSTLSEAFDHAC
jgi:predicted RNase H-like HicB family nuclease